MRSRHFIAVFAAVLVAATASAQSPPRGQPPAAATGKPYKPVAATPPKPMGDSSFDAFRKQLGEAAQRKDRLALARLTVAQGFFWQRENRDRADKRKAGIDNLSAALSLNNKDGVGWDILAGYVDDPAASAPPTHKDALCAPAEPTYSAQEFAALLKATQTEASDWGYPLTAGIDVRAAAYAGAPVIDKLELALVQISPGTASGSVAFLRITAPSGKIGFVSVDAIGPLGNDQICYVKDAAGWKVGGYIGGGEPQ